MFKVIYHGIIRFKYHKLNNNKMAFMDNELAQKYVIEITSATKPVIINCRYYVCEKKSGDWMITVNLPDFIRMFIFIADVEIRPFNDIHTIGFQERGYYFYPSTVKNYLVSIDGDKLKLNGVFIRNIGHNPAVRFNGDKYESLMVHFIINGDIRKLMENVAYVTDAMILASIYKPVIMQFLYKKSGREPDPIHMMLALKLQH